MHFDAFYNAQNDKIWRKQKTKKRNQKIIQLLAKKCP